MSLVLNFTGSIINVGVDKEYTVKYSTYSKCLL